jgi:hypothetical protein
MYLPKKLSRTTGFQFNFLQQILNIKIIPVLCQIVIISYLCTLKKERH